jgi:hypothetical protein
MRWRGRTRPGCTIRRLLSGPALPDRSPEARTKPRAPVSRPFRPSEVAFEMASALRRCRMSTGPGQPAQWAIPGTFKILFPALDLSTEPTQLSPEDTVVHRLVHTAVHSRWIPPAPSLSGALDVEWRDRGRRSRPKAPLRRGALAAAERPRAVESPSADDVPSGRGARDPLPRMRQLIGMDTPPPQVGVSGDTSTPAGRRIFRVRVFHAR